MNESQAKKAGSRRVRRALLVAGLAALGAQAGVEGVLAQDAAKVMPRSYRVAFENDKIRVLDFVAKPGMGVCGEGMHSHPAHLTIVMSDWQGKAVTPDGKIVGRDKKAGDVFWAEAETHRVENTGKTMSHVMIVELKGQQKP
ncbi:MAG TPA: hypothetical protein VFK92_01700 [Burkholderiales bacterium]|nr:hypothetical protein [Burkholderiales bacterium]